MIGRTLNSLLDIMRFRAGPQDLPAGAATMLLLAAIYIAEGFLASLVLGEPDYAPRALLAIAVQFALITALLNLKGLQARVQQTVAALSGTGFFFGLMSIFMLSRVNPDAPQAGLAVMYLLLFIWSLAVDGHIYRHALSSKIGTGVLVAVSIFTINFMLMRALFD